MTAAAPPPGPAGAGSADSLAEFNRDPLSFLRGCAATYGDIVRVRFDSWFYLLNRPDLVETVLQNKQGMFVKTIHPFGHDAQGRDPQSLKYTAFENLLGQGLLTADGDDWRRRRRILAPPFQPKPTTGYTPTIVSLVERLIADWQEGETVDVYEQMRELTLGVVGMALMGSDLSGQARDEGLAFKAAMEHFYHPSDDGLPFGEALDRLHRTADAIVAEHRAIDSNRSSE